MCQLSLSVFSLSKELDEDAHQAWTKDDTNTWRSVWLEDLGRDNANQMFKDNDDIFQGAGNNIYNNHSRN